MNRLFEEKPRLLWLFLVGSACLTALTLVFPSLGFLEWITLIPLIAVCFWLGDQERVKLKQCYGYGFLMVFVYYFILYHWFVRLYPLDFVGLDEGASMAVVLAGWLGLSLLQAIPGGLILLLYRLIARSGILRRVPLCKPILFAALWLVFEWSSTLSWMGVPWGRLCLGQVNYLSMLQISSIFGSYGVSLLILLVNGFLAYFLLYRQKQTLCFLLSAFLILGNLALGSLLMQGAKQGEKTLRAAVIQGNINSHEKWDLDSQDRIEETYESLTRQAAADGAELVIWPETALPYTFNHSQYLQDFVSDLARECNITLVFGAICTEKDAEYNSLFLVTAEGEVSEQRYNKRHLVPFGEFVPWKKVIVTVIPPLADLVSLGGEMTAGDSTALFDTPWGKVGSLICFDSIYEKLGMDSVRDGAELMIISSNDSWFYDSAAVYQHQAQAQLRAIEQGRYVLRAANTGISSVITPTGETLHWIEPLVEGYAVCDVSMRQMRTVYSVIGDLLIYASLLFIMSLPMIEWYVRKKRTI